MSPIVRESLLTEQQVADWLQMPVLWVRKHSRPQGPEPRLPARDFGRGSYRYRREDIEQWLDHQFAASAITPAQGKSIQLRRAS